MKEMCDRCAEQAAVLRLTLTTLDGEVRDRVALCADCAFAMKMDPRAR